MENQTTKFTSLKIKNPTTGMGKRISGDTPDTGTLTLAGVSADAEKNIVNNPNYDSNKPEDANNSKILNGTMFYSEKDKGVAFYANNTRKTMGFGILNAGEAILANGTKTVNCPGMKANSLIFVSGKAIVNGFVPEEYGSLRVALPNPFNENFTVISTLNNEDKGFYWAVINI